MYCLHYRIRERVKAERECVRTKISNVCMSIYLCAASLNKTVQYFMDVEESHRDERVWCYLVFGGGVNISVRD